MGAFLLCHRHKQVLPGQKLIAIGSGSQSHFYAGARAKSWQSLMRIWGQARFAIHSA